MITRIKYKKNETGKLISKPLLAGNGSIVLSLDDVNMSYVVTSYETGELLVSGQSKTLSQLKRDVKAKAKHLGVSFADEMRKNLKAE